MTHAEHAEHAEHAGRWRSHRSGDRPAVLAAVGLLAVVAVLAAVISLAGCGGESRPELVVYSPHGREILTYFQKKFEAQHPGVEVAFIDMGSQEVLDRLRSEKANPQGDVWWGAPSEMFERGADEGLLAPYRPSWADALPPDRRDPKDRWYGNYLTPEVIGYNEEALARAEVPRMWDSLLAPRWKGKILVRDPLASGTMRSIFGGIMAREYARTGSSTAGFAWLRRLDAQTREYVLNPTLLYQKLARREGLLTLWNMPDIEILRSRTDFPIQYVIPEDGTPIVVDAVAVVAGASQPELARQFEEMIGSREGLMEAAEHFFRIPARTDLPLDSLPAWLREAAPLIHPLPGDPEVLRDSTPKWLRYWDLHIRGRGDKEE